MMNLHYEFLSAGRLLKFRHATQNKGGQASCNVIMCRIWSIWPAWVTL
uniref:Uncharacterized protein n=1 Tax=Arundo donax TaxID=35708 RepID=A0A0A8Y7C3_ARUDO